MNILITGTNSGIGHALAIEFLDHGATVYGISRQFNDRLKSYDDYHHLSQDLMKLDDLPENLSKLLRGVKTLDLVVLNAGILININDLRKTPLDEITTVMRVNVWANKVIIDTLLEEIPNMYQVVAISCGSVINNARGLNAYSLSKLALNKMIKLYAKEMPKTHFSALAPGYIDSSLQKHISQLPNVNNYPVIKKLRLMRENGQLTEPRHAANYLVEAMGTILQEESGTYREVKDILFLEPDGFHYSRQHHKNKAKAASSLDGSR
jgi:benzil reductase ((S)-benzoin forming)